MTVDGYVVDWVSSDLEPGERAVATLAKAVVRQPLRCIRLRDRAAVVVPTGAYSVSN
jgi:hypothetical protein